MKKTIILILMLAVMSVGVSFGQKDVAVLKPKVVGGTVSQNDQMIITQKMKVGFQNLGGYEIYSRQEQWFIDAEQEFQRSGRVSEGSIKKVGEAKGVSYICVFTLSQEGSELVVSADIIDIEKQKYENNAMAFIADRTNRQDMLRQCEDLPKQLLGRGVSSSDPYKPGKQISGGVNIGGIVWATCNVGSTPGKFAPNPKVSGGLYTWTEAQNACPTGWRLPDKDELEVLISEGSKWTDKGREFGSGGNTIFMPAAGYRNYSDGSLNNVGTYGDYWSSTPNGSERAYYLYFYSGNATTYYYYRMHGQSVRCVAE